MDINLITFQFALPLAIRACLHHSPLESLPGEHPLEVFHQGLAVGAEVGNLAWTKKRTMLTISNLTFVVFLPRCYGTRGRSTRRTPSGSPWWPRLSGSASGAGHPGGSQLPLSFKFKKMCYWKFAILNAISLQKMQLKYRQKICFPHHELESHFVVRTGCQLLPLWQGAKGHYFFADLCGENNYFLQKWYAVLFGNCLLLPRNLAPRRIPVSAQRGRRPAGGGRRNTT